ncbi:MAG: hypothetical protein LW830_02465, partial [Phenylobacterium sp.]|nr:hypothetical protein [Phenylobacterium sp.]
RALADGYPDASIADYVLSGRYFRAAGRRFRNWRRDTFRPAETTAGVKAGWLDLLDRGGDHPV